MFVMFYNMSAEDILENWLTKCSSLNSSSVLAKEMRKDNSVPSLMEINYNVRVFVFI